MIRIKIRVVEIALRIVGHADSFHDAPRTEIVHRRKCDDLLKPEFFKGIGQNSTRTFLSVSSTPIIECEPPTNFRAWRKWKRVSWNVKTDKTDECLWVFEFGGPEAKSLLLKLFFDFCDYGFRLKTVEGLWIEFHDARIGVQFGKRLGIAGVPPAEN